MADIGRLLSGLIKGSTEGVRAFHSSPHDFERFDLSKIGTGEGAQVYGHGVYAAENPAVSGQGGEYWKSFLRRFEGTPEGAAAEYMNVAKFDRDAALKLIERDIGLIRNNPAWRDVADHGVKALQTSARMIESGQPVGPRTYEVNIRARPEQFLDWDKPLSQQPTAVQEFADRLKVKPWRAQDQLLGSEIYRAGERASSFGHYGVSPPHKELAEAGIPGVRYLDQGSRIYPTEIMKRRLDLAREMGDADKVAMLERELATNKPTSNYVVFDPARIDILRKYGLAGMAPIAGAAALAPGQAEASMLPIKRQPPELPNQSMGPALAALTAGDAENQAAADAMRVPGPPAPPPLPQRPLPPPSLLAPMLANPAGPPEWATGVVQSMAPHLTDPATYQGRLPPTIATNSAGKTYPPEMTHPWQGAAADLANLATNFIGAGF